MTRIQILPEDEARKIAAGEVIERPASVVKELIENSLDAQAAEIYIELKDGGKSLLMVRDTGSGMSQDDARLCVERHATSKIRSVHELSSLHTFGFRGEALASIAAVSSMQLITRQQEDAHGYKLKLLAGKLVHEGPAAANRGTCVIVEDLFFNVPARRAFLKQRETEWRAIQQLVTAYALAFPRVGFTVIHDTHTTLNLAPCASTYQRAQQLFSSEEGEHLIEIPFTTQRNITVQGYLSTQSFTRYDRRFVMSFINQRWVKNQSLSKAILAGYQNSLSHGKYPYAAITLSLPPEQIDVNIHPRKEEVLLLHPYVVTDIVEATITRLLNEQVASKLSPTQNYGWTGHPSPLQSYGRTSQPAYEKLVESNVQGTVSTYTAPNLEVTAPTTSEAENTLVPEVPTHTLLGILQATYLLIETHEGLMIIDQHAAHERIIFDQLQHTSQNTELTELLFPELIPLSTEEYAVLPQIIPHLAQVGICAEPWSSSQLIIRATGVLLKQLSVRDIVMKLITAYQTERALSSERLSQETYYDIYALIACKTAVKAGDILAPLEVEKLITAYLATPNRMTCPHGRPTSWLISSQHMERMFKRTGNA